MFSFSCEAVALAGEFGADDLGGEGQTLTALHLAAEAGIGSAGAGAARGARGIADLTFTKGIADADDHERIPGTAGMIPAVANRYR